ncbi:MAG: glycosyltransferase [Candidatus Krumholzibacteriota bacterium]|nr:glycosyltransferase [Candidatus Krumholzibacteriota bacterium]
MKILWVKNNLLHPLDSGGKLRTFNMLREIARDHEVHFAAFARPGESEAVEKSAEYCRRLFTAPPPAGPAKKSPAWFLRVAAGLLSPLPWTVASYRSTAMRRLLAERLAAGRYDVVVADFLTMIPNIPECPGVPRAHFSHNIEAMIWERSAANEGNPVKRLVFRRECARTRRFERLVAQSFDAVIAVSARDAAFFAEVYGARRAAAIPTGVDTGYFSPAGVEPEAGRIVFLGSMDWMPNVDAVRWFAAEILPRVREAVPGVVFSIVGRDPAPAVRALAGPGVEVTGTVPDTRPHVARAACAVVPIRVGGGTRIKIYELMSAGAAVVSTTIGAEGLEYRDGENILIADEPAAFAAAVAGVLTDGGRRRSLGAAARAFVAEHCAWESVARRFVEALPRTTEGDDR